MVKQKINNKSAPVKKKAAPKKKPPVKKKAAKRKAPAKKRASKRTSVKTKKSSRKSSSTRKASSASSKKKSTAKTRAKDKSLSLHKDGTEQFATSDELFENIPNFYGRPTIYTLKMVNKICGLISMGYSLNKICSYSDMPNISTVLRWLNEEGKGSFKDKYARAHEMKNEVVEGEIMDIADNVAQPYVHKGKPVLIKGKPIMIVDNASVQHARLRIDTRTRHMEVTKPKKWGRNVDLGQGVGGLLEMMDIAAGRLMKFKKEEAVLIDGKTGKVVEEAVCAKSTT